MIKDSFLRICQVCNLWHEKEKLIENVKNMRKIKLNKDFYIGFMSVTQINRFEFQFKAFLKVQIRRVWVKQQVLVRKKQWGFILKYIQHDI